MSAFDDFYNYANGKVFDTNGNVSSTTSVNWNYPYDGQCVSLIKAYLKYLGYGVVAYGNAIDYWTNKNNSGILKVCDVVSGNPQNGDIGVSAGSDANYGHVFIYKDGKAFAQNVQGPKASLYSLNGQGLPIYGYLRPKYLSSSTTSTSSGNSISANYVYKVWLKFSSESASQSALSSVQKTISDAFRLTNKGTAYIQVGAFSTTSEAVARAGLFTSYDRVIQKTLSGVIQSTYKSYAAATSTKTTASSSATSYTVKITADVLNVRKSASIDSAIVTTVKKGEVYTIIGETKESSSGITWGKLKSGLGYISLAYTSKC